MKNKICLLGMKDIKNFLNIISDLDGKIELFNPKTNYRINARSLLGLIMASSEWSGVFHESLPEASVPLVSFQASELN